MTFSDRVLLDTISQTIFDKKGFNILVLDVRDFSTLTDYFIIAEGTVARHAQGLCIAIKDQLQETGLIPYHIEGKVDGSWIVMDYGNIIIHILIPEMREKYALEQLWKQAKIVDVKIKVKEIS